MTAAAFERALDRATELLGASRFPLIAGLEVDVAALTAAFRLAERLGGAIDHAASETSLRDQAVLQDIGLMLVSTGEARRQADTFFVVGDGPFAVWPDLPDLLFGDTPTHLDRPAPRRVLAFSRQAPHIAGRGVEVTWREAAGEALPAILGALRARIRRHPVSDDVNRDSTDRLAEMLIAAKFGVALWSPAELDALTIEMLAGLVKDLNAATRWSGLSVAADPTVAAAEMAAGWMAALPLRTGFPRGYPEHDPWRFEARRLVESGEADAVLWISAFGNPPPSWLEAVPTVLVADELESSRAVTVLHVGRPGRDHDAVLYDRRTGTLVGVAASSPRALPTAADALNGIAQRLAAR
jgi:formylmethanofuran dehydrogenase subunit B